MAEQQTTTIKNRQPLEEDFPQEEIFTETIKWRELPLGVWEIIKAKQVNTRYGPALVLTVKNDSEGTKDVWAPDRLQRNLHEKPKTQWILHQGFATSKKNPERRYFNFKLM